MPKEPIGYYEKRFANRMTKKGLPDMHICIKGMSLEVEVKADDGVPSVMQLFMCNQIRNSGGFAIVLYPSGFERFKAFVRDFIHEKYTHEMEVIIK